MSLTLKYMYKHKKISTDHLLTHFNLTREKIKTMRKVGLFEDWERQSTDAKRGYDFNCFLMMFWRQTLITSSPFNKRMITSILMDLKMKLFNGDLPHKEVNILLDKNGIIAYFEKIIKLEFITERIGKDFFILSGFSKAQKNFDEILNTFKPNQMSEERKLETEKKMSDEMTWFAPEINHEKII